MRMAAEVFKSMSRNDAAKLVMQASVQAMGPGGS